MADAGWSGRRNLAWAKLEFGLPFWTGVELGVEIEEVGSGLAQLRPKPNPNTNLKFLLACNLHLFNRVAYGEVGPLKFLGLA